MNALASSSFTDPLELLRTKDPSLNDALAALSSPELEASHSRYLVAWKACRVIRDVLQSSEDLDSYHLLFQKMIEYWSACSRKPVLSRWALGAAFELHLRSWELDTTEIFVPSTRRLHSFVRQTNCSSTFRIIFERDQLLYFVENHAVARFPFVDFATQLERVAESIDAFDASDPQPAYTCFDLSDLHRHFVLSASFGRSVHFHPLPFSWLLHGNGDPILLASEALAVGASCVGWDSVEAEYRSSVSSDGGGYAIVDNVLKPDVARELFQWLCSSSFWWDSRSGYLGTYLDYWEHPGVLRLAEELQTLLPNVLGDHDLYQAWAYIYDNDPQNKNSKGSAGIPEHADTALVNVNIWLTPDEFNNAENTGGLVIFNRRPPSDWSSRDLNQRPDLIRGLLDGDGQEFLEPAKNITASYKWNRMVVFDSALFHRTDHHHFNQKGHTRRRINLTLLFGSPTKETQAT